MQNTDGTTLPADRYIVLWLNAFIPSNHPASKEVLVGQFKGKYCIDGPPGWNCFLGDSRMFTSVRLPKDSQGNFLYRLTSFVGLFFTDPDNPIPGSNHDTGVTTMIDCASGDFINQGKASSDDLHEDWGNVTSSSATVRLYGSASNPLVTPSPPIRYDLTFSIGLNVRGTPDSGGVVTYSGKVGEYPAFEAYIQSGTRPITTIFQIPPDNSTDVWNLMWQLLRKDVASRTVFF